MSDKKTSPPEYKFKQKFLRGYRVKIADTMPEWMSHFEKGGEAIVDHTSLEVHKGNLEDLKSYSLVLLNKEGKSYTRGAWYGECQLTLISDDILEGYAIIEQFNILLAREPDILVKRRPKWGVLI